MTESNIKIVSAKVSDSQLESLDHIADRFSVTRSIVIRWAIDEYLRRFFLTDRPTDKTNVLPVTDRVETPA